MLRLVSCNIYKVNKNISEVFIVFSLKKCFNLISCKDLSNFDFFVSDLCLELFVNIFIFLLQIKKKKKTEKKKKKEKKRREGVSKKSLTNSFSLSPPSPLVVWNKILSILNKIDKFKMG